MTSYADTGNDSEGATALLLEETPGVDDQAVAGSGSEDAGLLTTETESGADSRVERAIKEDMVRFPSYDADEIASMHDVTTAFVEYISAIRGSSRHELTDTQHETICIALRNPHLNQSDVASEADVSQPTVSNALSTLEEKFDITP